MQRCSYKKGRFRASLFLMHSKKVITSPKRGEVRRGDVLELSEIAAKSPLHNPPPPWGGDSSDNLRVH